jgi:hypothetical protein
MRLFTTLGALAALVLAASPAVADPVAKPAETKAATPCKRVVVGRGLERRVFCELATPIVVKAGPARPQVAIVHHDGRAVVGPTRTTDPFAGLSHQLR